MLRSTSASSHTSVDPRQYGHATDSHLIDQPAWRLSQSREALLRPSEPLRRFDDVSSPTTRSASFQPVRQAIGDAFRHIASAPITGRNASYIKALEERDVEHFAVSAVTFDGGQESHGDAAEPFTMQSLGKPLAYLQAVIDQGLAAVRSRVECRDSRVPFNSPATVGVLARLGDDPEPDKTLQGLMALKTPPTTSALRSRLRSQGDTRPPNASTNFGALTTTSLISHGAREGSPNPRDRVDAQVARTQALFDAMASREPAERGCASRRPCSTIDRTVFLSEINDSAGNQTLARLVHVDELRRRGHSSTEALDHPQAAQEAFHITEAYTKICAISTHAAALAAGYATLANGGRNPFTGEQVLEPRLVESTLAHMALNGLYEPTRDFVDRTGFIVKTGVAGGVVAIDPLTKMTFAVYSSPLDAQGNSVRGLAFLEALARSPAYQEMRRACALAGTTNRRPWP